MTFAVFPWEIMKKKIPRAIFTSGQQLALVVATSYRAAKRGAAAVTVKISGANEGALVWQSPG